MRPRLNTPDEAFNFKLGATLTMEKTVLEILDDAIESAQDERVKGLLSDHRGESEQARPRGRRGLRPARLEGR